MERQENKPKLPYIWRKLFNHVRGQLALEGLTKVGTKGQANGTSGDQRWRDDSGHDVRQNRSNSRRVGRTPINIPVENPPMALKDIPVDEEQHAAGNEKQKQQNHVTEGNPRHGKSNEVWDINQRSEAFIRRKKSDLGTPTPSGIPNAPASAACTPRHL